MNAERLHAIAVALRQEIHDNGTLQSLQSLVSALQAVAQQSNATTQQNLASALNAFFNAVTDVSSDTFSPAWRQILIEMSGEGLFGKTLKERAQQIIAKNQMTPIVAHQEMETILEELRKFMKGLDSTISAFSQFSIGTEELRPGEAEITLLVPRRAVEDKLREFADELHEL